MLAVQCAQDHHMISRDGVDVGEQFCSFRLLDVMEFFFLNKVLCKLTFWSRDTVRVAPILDVHVVSW